MVLSGLDEDDSQRTRTVGAEDDDAFDVAGAAGAGDERDHAWKIRRVFLLQKSESGGQIRHELFAPRDDDVLR